MRLPLPDCNLGGKCDLRTREIVYGDKAPGVAQCLNCSEVKEPTPEGWQSRHCDACNRDWGESLHDPCLGFVEGACEACCGHGDDLKAYVSYRDGRRLEGPDALSQMRW